MKKDKLSILLNIVFVCVFITIIGGLFMPYFINKKIDLLMNKYPGTLLKMYIYEFNYNIEKTKKIDNHKSEQYKNMLKKIIAKYPIILINQNILNEQLFLNKKLGYFIKLGEVKKTKDGIIIIKVNNKNITYNKNVYKKYNINKVKKSFCFMTDLNYDLFLNNILPNKSFNTVMNNIANIVGYNNIAKYLGLNKDICIKPTADGYLLLYKK